MEMMEVTRLRMRMTKNKGNDWIILHVIQFHLVNMPCWYVVVCALDNMLINPTA
jgi:hypothetical protein